MSAATTERTTRRVRRRPGVPWMLGVAIVVAVAGALLGGGLLAGNAAKRPPSKRITTAAIGPLALTVPPGWRVVEPGPEVPGFRRRQQLAIARAGHGGRTAAVASMTDPGNGGVLPDELLRHAGGPAGRGTPVRLGDLEGFRFDAVRSAGNGGAPMTVYAIPTVAGTATLACLGEAADSSTCARLAGGLRVAAEPLPVQPASRYGAAVEKAFRALNATRDRGLARLRSAGTRGKQAEAASQIAAAYSTAAGRLGSAPDRRMVADENLEIVRALEAVARAYGSMARSATRDDVAGYGAARGEAVAAERGVGRALRRLRDAGYRVR